MDLMQKLWVSCRRNGSVLESNWILITFHFGKKLIARVDEFVSIGSPSHLIQPSDAGRL